ncbi:hypothetical protein Desdi_2598 [Desulfitobacterium dichloroeliminans LMG P-21439]|uniref:Uncharacterized protein n=1 Tax=Desulfitobacterium dichloroeliminans (strain LMG P-21439 / DCA1) TaxID=871963 RepID=L0F887_DESDL|nr:hypothetical protein [Desulfitobacterium dichloroeliminans]AGA70014.1 hypothetical protein Desdi_2598 [Desulfitobacterium dichloroeliminans LMG P-21439]
MEDQVYSYQLKPLVIPGVLYLAMAPILYAVLYYGLKIAALETDILLWVYSITAVGIIAIWMYGRSKKFRVTDNQLVFSSLRGEYRLSSAEIRRIALFTTKQGKEIVQIKTKSQDYYLSDLYFPFPELMTELEQYIKENDIRTNFSLT